SVSAADKDLRVADARKTLMKFTAAEVDFTTKHGATALSAKLTYSLNTNRPISAGMLEALHAASKDEVPPSGDGKTQLDQLHAAVPLTGDRLKSFVSRVL